MTERKKITNQSTTTIQSKDIEKHYDCMNHNIKMGNQFKESIPSAVFSAKQANNPVLWISIFFEIISSNPPPPPPLVIIASTNLKGKYRIIRTSL